MNFRTESKDDREPNAIWGDGERIFRREWTRNSEGEPSAVLVVAPAGEVISAVSIDRLTHEYSLRDELDGDWAARPLGLKHEADRVLLLLEDPGGAPLEQLIGQPMETGEFLRLAISMVDALGKMHQSALVHKDIKPTNILVNCTDGRTRLTGFGVASRLPRERLQPQPPEFIAGTLAYMAPEQTGRMNRSIDSRSDLYAMGMTFYRMLVGQLPFSASEPMEWVHCQIARRPMPPSERLKNIPVQVSDIVMKLLAKRAEERYQTASGLQRDLQQCLAEWNNEGRITSFPCGERDRPDRLLIPEKLYGRERQVEALLAAFNRVLKCGAPVLVLVSGYSGVGKSSVVNELHKVLVPPRGLFASGKFDELKRDVPYSTLAEAFRGVLRSLLSAGEEELAGWRTTLRAALGPNGRLIADLLPELTMIVGEQPPAPKLEPNQAKGQFQLAFRRFISVFARPGQPLTLFLDDLQWLDAATLDFIEDLFTGSDIRNLMLIGAFRDNEVDAHHPLTRRLDTLQKSGIEVSRIELDALDLRHIRQMIGDATAGGLTSADALSELVYAKTAGNPLFAMQFLNAFADEGLLAFDQVSASWNWNFEATLSRRYADNVVDLMLRKLARIPIESREALQELACLGNRADDMTLSTVLELSSDAANAALWEAVRAGLIERLPNGYRFAHDRIQEAAYSLIPDRKRAAAHLRIGRLLLAQTSVDKQEEGVFEIVGHLNRGSEFLESDNEREDLARLNLIAGRRAKASAAYASALNYLVAGAALTSVAALTRRRELVFELEFNRAQCEYLIGEFFEAEQRLATLSTLAANEIERAAIACLRIDLFYTLGQLEAAVATGLEYLATIGLSVRRRATEDDARSEFERIQIRLRHQAIEEFIAQPPMSDQQSFGTLQVLTKCAAPAAMIDENLYVVLISRAVDLSFEWGMSDGSCFALAWLGLTAGVRFGDHDLGFRLAQCAYDFVDQKGLTGAQARTYFNFGCVLAWTRPFSSACEVFRRASEAGSKTGDHIYVAASSVTIVAILLMAGGHLADIQHEAERGLAFAQKMGFGLFADIAAAQVAFARSMRGLTPRFGFLDSECLQESVAERRFSSDANQIRNEFMYWVRKLQLRFHAGDYESALDASLKASRLTWVAKLTFEIADYDFYSALARAMSFDVCAEDARGSYFDALVDHHKRIQTLASSNPNSFGNWAALIGAEIARITGRTLDAMDLYENSIRLAQENHQTHNEALANELAARFYMMRGIATISRAYLRNARHCYALWGADAKVQQLDARHTFLRERTAPPGETSTIQAPVEQLDLATVISVSQAIASETLVGKLIETLTRTAMAHAGAERAVLVLAQEGEPRVVAEASTDGETISVYPRDERASELTLPNTLLHYVLRTRETVVLDDAKNDPRVLRDIYVSQRQVRSALAVPLINQSTLIGVLYLENNLSPGAFVAARTTVLKLLASLAAVSLQNSQLYSKIRRLIDANIVGVYFWTRQGRILDANGAFLSMLGFEREDIVDKPMRWTELAPPEWASHTASILECVMNEGAAQPVEMEYYRKDRTRAPVLVGSARLLETGDEGIAFVLDLTEQKRAAEALGNMERELAHANRVATMGQLAASIAHEVNQPISAIVANAGAGLRWLHRPMPDLGEASKAFDRVQKDGQRAAAVVARIRDLAKKTPPQTNSVEINAAIREVIDLTAREAMESSVTVTSELVEELPLAECDRVELQQVMLNLIMNSIEAMKDVGQGPRELHISSRKTAAGEVTVSVMDTGGGIAVAAGGDLFEAFYTTKPNGLGLGLSICRSIVQGHGGRLWTSPNEPRGAVFHFTLMALQDDCEL